MCVSAMCVRASVLEEFTWQTSSRCLIIAHASSVRPDACVHEDRTTVDAH